MANQMRIDPQAMKDYRVDVCVYGTLSLFQARDAYLASMGKDEPSEKKIPSFGIAGPPPPKTAAVAASGSASAAPAASAEKPHGKKEKAAAAAAASGSAAASASPAAPPHKFDFARAPYERNARACVAAAALKEPAMADVDTAVKEFAPFAAELAKAIVTANGYYSREEYKKDNFEKGKTLHKTLTDDFAKLDENYDKLDAAVKTWRAAHPVDEKAEGGQKLALHAVEDGKAALVAFARKPDEEAFKAAAAKVSKDLDEVKAFATEHPTDTWAKIMNTPLGVYVKGLTEAQEKFDPKEASVFLTLVNGFVGTVEARQRALSRSMQHGGMPLLQRPGRGPHPAIDRKPAAAQPSATPHE
jgi:hypothetical protein